MFAPVRDVYNGGHLAGSPKAKQQPKVQYMNEEVDIRAAVERVVAERTAVVAAAAGLEQLRPLLGMGKMLRTRLAGRLAEAGRVSGETLAPLCGAVELLHAASLCHDDVIDSAPVRRSHPALWHRTSPSGAVLIGDLLMCEAIDLLLGVEGGRHMAPFVSKLREV